MKICIITVYNSMNYGAFFQAYALYNILEETNNNVSFLNTGARKNFSLTFKLISKSILSLNFKKALFEIEKYYKFSKHNRKYKICKNSKRELDGQDIFVFGSDEIWNISRKSIKDFPILYGIGIPHKFLVSYAPSINRTTIEHVNKNQEFIESIQRFNRLSVRDKHSQNVIKAITNKDVELVMDPTFLFGIDKYNAIEESIGEKNYILVYGYPNRFTSENIKEIIGFSKKKNLKLISVGNYLKWCEKNIAASPFEFLSYVKKADYVITNTFHGTIFSIIYNKQFASYAGEQVKVEDVLRSLELESRNVSSETSLDNALNEGIDYLTVESKIKIAKESSQNYIYSFLKNAKGNKNENSQQY